MCNYAYNRCIKISKITNLFQGVPKNPCPYTSGPNTLLYEALVIRLTRLQKKNNFENERIRFEYNNKISITTF